MIARTPLWLQWWIAFRFGFAGAIEVSKARQEGGVYQIKLIRADLGEMGGEAPRDFRYQIRAWRLAPHAKRSTKGFALSDPR